MDMRAHPRDFTVSKYYHLQYLRIQLLKLEADKFSASEKLAPSSLKPSNTAFKQFVLLKSARKRLLRVNFAPVKLAPRKIVLFPSEKSHNGLLCLSA
jgi:hypothetical protein